MICILASCPYRQRAARQPVPERRAAIFPWAAITLKTPRRRPIAFWTPIRPSPGLSGPGAWRRSHLMENEIPDDQNRERNTEEPQNPVFHLNYSCAIPRFTARADALLHGPIIVDGHSAAAECPPAAAGELAIDRGCALPLGCRTAIRRIRLPFMVRGPLGGIRRSGPCPGGRSRPAGAAVIGLFCMDRVSVAIDTLVSLARFITSDPRNRRCRRRSGYRRRFGWPVLGERDACHQRERCGTRQQMSRHFGLSL